MSRQDAERRGRWAELFVAFFLFLTGHHILERRWRCPYGELDIVASKRNTIIFCEVKYRRHSDASAIPAPAQRARMCRAARAYLQYAHVPADTACRFDLILLNAHREMQTPFFAHIKNAWRCR